METRLSSPRLHRFRCLRNFSCAVVALNSKRRLRQGNVPPSRCDEAGQRRHEVRVGGKRKPSLNELAEIYRKYVGKVCLFVVYGAFWRASLLNGSKVEAWFVPELSFSSPGVLCVTKGQPRMYALLSLSPHSFVSPYWSRNFMLQWAAMLMAARSDFRDADGNGTVVVHRLLQCHASPPLEDAILNSSKNPVEDEDGWQTVRSLSTTRMYLSGSFLGLRSQFCWHPCEDQCLHHPLIAHVPCAL